MAIYEGIKQITFGGNTYKLAGGDDGGSGENLYDSVGTVFLDISSSYYLNSNGTNLNNSSWSPAYSSQMYPLVCGDTLRFGDIVCIAPVDYSQTQLTIQNALTDYSYSSYGNPYMPEMFTPSIRAIIGNDKVYALGRNALTGLIHGIDTVSFPECIMIGAGAFCSTAATNSSTEFLSISFPKCEIIGNGAFANLCKLLPSDCSFPKCKIVGVAAFGEHWQNPVLYMPECKVVNAKAFAYAGYYIAGGLTSVILPKCEYIGAYAFQSDSYIIDLSLPSCKRIDNFAFAGAYRLTNISLPLCSYIGVWAFSGCSSMTTAYLPQCSSIGANAFVGCSKLTSVYLLYSNVVSVGSYASYVFQYMSMSINGVYGSIYVPSSLVSLYKANTLWAGLASRIFAMP